MLRNKNIQRNYLGLLILLSIFQFCGQRVKAENIIINPITAVACENFSVSVIMPTLPDNGVLDCDNPSQYTASIQGGVAPFQYDWFSNGRHTDPILELSTSYLPNRVLTITDANGCVAKDTFDVRGTQSPLAKLTYTITEDSITFHLEDQLYVATHTLDTTNFPDFKGIDYPHPLPPSGVYFLSINIMNPCGNRNVGNGNIIINGSCENLSVSLSANHGSPHTLFAWGRGGTPPYTFTSNAEKIGDDFFQISCGGIYYGTVTDANGCTATDTLDVDLSADGDITYSIKNDTIHFGLSNRKNYARINDWSTNMPGGILENTYASAALPPVGTYEICVRLSNYCTDWKPKCITITITQEDINASNNGGQNCENLELELRVVSTGSGFGLNAIGKGGTPPYTFTANAVDEGNGYFNIWCTKNGLFYGTVTDANGCTATDTLFNVNTYPTGDIEYSIKNDTVYFRLENQKNVNFISHWSTDMPGGILAGTRNAAALPPNGRYQIFVQAPGQCSDGGISKWVDINSNEPEEPEPYTCEDGIAMDVYLGTQAEVENFAKFYQCSNNCGYIRGNVTINGSDIRDLSGLDFITGIQRNLRIENCPNLTSLDGLQNISKIDMNLIINSLPRLASLDGIDGAALKKVQNLNIRNNDNLVDISALTGMENVYGHLFLINNPKLTSLDGIQQINNVGKRLVVEGMTALVNAADLCNLFRNGNIGGIIKMSNNNVRSNNPFQVLKGCNLAPDNCGNKGDFSFEVKGNTVHFNVNNQDAAARYLWKLETGIFTYTKDTKLTYSFSQPGEYKVNLKTMGSCMTGISKTIIIPETAFDKPLPTTCTDDIDWNLDGRINNADIDYCECVNGEAPRAEFIFKVDGNTVFLANTSSENIGAARWITPFPIADGKMTVPEAMSVNVCIEVETVCHRKDEYCQTISIGSACDNLTEKVTNQNRIAIETTIPVQEIAPTLMPIQKQVATNRSIETMTIKATVLKHANCIDSEDGSVEVTVEGGQLPYQYMEISGENEKSKIVEGNIFTKLDADTYTLKVVDAGGKEVTTQIVVKAVQSDPIANFEVEEVDGKLTFINTSENAGRWSWTFNEQTSYEESPTPELVEDFQEVCLEVANGCNAKDYFCETIDRKQWRKENQTTSTSLSKIKPSTPTTDFEVKAYPNPTVDQLTVSYNSATELQNIEVYNLAGKLLQTVQPQSTTSTSVALGNYPAGMYLVKVNGLTSSKVLKINRIE